MVKSDITGMITVSEALEVLKDSLRQHGLDHVNISISSHGLTQEQSDTMARNIFDGGFGKKVSAAQAPVQYQGREGWFSWITVEQDSDVINLFFNLDDDDQLINYLRIEKEAS